MHRRYLRIRFRTLVAVILVGGATAGLADEPEHFFDLGCVGRSQRRELSI